MRCAPDRLGFLVELEPHTDEPMQRAHGINSGVQGLVALAFAARVPEADRTPPPEAGDDALRGELAKELGIALDREVQMARTRVGKPQPREQRILGGIDANQEQRHLALGAGGTARPERIADHRVEAAFRRRAGCLGASPP